MPACKLVLCIRWMECINILNPFGTTYFHININGLHLPMKMNINAFLCTFMFTMFSFTSCIRFFSHFFFILNHPFPINENQFTHSLPQRGKKYNTAPIWICAGWVGSVSFEISINYYIFSELSTLNFSPRFFGIRSRLCEKFDISEW